MPVQQVEQRVEAREQHRLDADPEGVSFQVFPVQAVSERRIDIRKTDAYQARGTVGDVGAPAIVGNLAAAVAALQLLQHRHHVGCGVDQGAVEVE